MNKKSRGWCFTINNYTDEDIKTLGKIREECRYAIAGMEIGEQKTPHIQGYVYFETPRYLTSIGKKYIPRGHLIAARGLPEQNKSYCEKDGNLLFEFGEIPKQGKRTDLIDLKEDLKNKKKTVQEIRDENPNLYHQFGRTLDKLEDDYALSTCRNWKTETIWYYGKTGSGKSHRAYEGKSPGSYYDWVEDNGWWDGYRGQELVIMDEFRGQLPFWQLLRLTDKHPYEVKRRARQPTPFLAKKIIITSCMPPWEMYNNLKGSDSIEQLLRRIKTYQCNIDGTMEQKCSEGNSVTSEPVK